MSQKSDTINAIIKHFEYRDYLEIGIRAPAGNFDLIEAPGLKYGCDPHLNMARAHGREQLFMKTSDAFFRDNFKTFDLIFIDGLHLEVQVMRDIENAMRCLNMHGTILMHDCNPTSEVTQRDEMVQGKAWFGTTWKAFVKMRYMRPDLYYCTIQKSGGLSVIRYVGECPRLTFYESDHTLPYSPPNLRMQKMDFKFFNQYRDELLNPRSLEDFFRDTG